MNLLLLLLGLRPWSAPTSTARFTRIFAAISLLSVEMQLVTWLGVGSLRSVVAFTAVVAGVLWFAWPPRPAAGDTARAVPAVAFGGPSLLAALPLTVLVVALNAYLPSEAADPYHLEKVAHIEATGTLSYDPRAEPKINILNSTYELLLADLRHVPVVGPALVQGHGLLFLALYLVTLGSVRELLGARDSWLWAVLMAVPVMFHQLVLLKNDLLVAMPALIVLVWVIVRARTAPWREAAWAGWLAGLAAAIKPTTLPLVVVLAAAIAVYRRTDWRPYAAAGCGGLLGLAAGGVGFSLVENVRLYGGLLPVENLGNRTTSVVTVATSLFRFGVSLLDLGVVTRVVWPGRGGWGGTFGLPLIWAVAVLLRSRTREARAALLAAGACFVMFAAVFPDADLTHRLVLGPGLLLIVVAVHTLDRDGTRHAWLRLGAVPVVVLSAAQILRSAAQYVGRH